MCCGWKILYQEAEFKELGGLMAYDDEANQ